MRQWIRFTLFLLIGVAMLPASAYAQASLTGVVRDTSGAVLPGVTVEAASPDALNVDTVLTENINFAVWRRPVVILPARFVKFSAQVDF